MTGKRSFFRIFKTDDILAIERENISQNSFIQINVFPVKRMSQLIDFQVPLFQLLL